MFDKAEFVLKNKFMYLDTEDLVGRCNDANHMISSIALEELITRDTSSLDISSEDLNKIASKLSIEQLWNLASSGTNSELTSIAVNKINKLLNYYELKNARDFLNKKNEGEQPKLFILK